MLWFAGESGLPEPDLPRCRREPDTAPTPQLVGRSLWEPEVWSGCTHVCMHARCGRGGVTTGRSAHQGV